MLPRPYVCLLVASLHPEFLLSQKRGLSRGRAPVSFVDRGKGERQRMAIAEQLFGIPLIWEASSRVHLVTGIIAKMEIFWAYGNAVLLGHHR